MDKITCKHCGTKYPADVSKCPLCGASNAPAVGDEFDFLDDDFEATPAPQPAAPAEAPETPADTAAAAEKPAEETGSAEQVTFDGGAPSSGNTSRYNWEEILAEINRQKEDGGAAKQPEPEEAPQPAAPAAPQAPAAETVPEDDEDDKQG